MGLKRKKWGQVGRGGGRSRNQQRYVQAIVVTPLNKLPLSECLIRAPPLALPREKGSYWKVLLRLNGREHVFLNAEAAFQSLKFWDRAEEFTQLTGKEAFVKKVELKGQEDRQKGLT